MCYGYACSKYSLAILNVFYLVVSLILIGVAAYAKAVAKITSLELAGGIVACGVFLLLIAIVGIIGAVKHHQVLLFFYMIVLGLLFIIQFSIACACLALNKEQQFKLAEAGWAKSNNKTKTDLQFSFNCCGFNTFNASGIAGKPGSGHPSCVSLPCCDKEDCCRFEGNCTCTKCWDKLEPVMGTAMRSAGGVGLFFSFTEVAGIVLAYRLRKLEDELGGFEDLQ